MAIFVSGVETVGQNYPCFSDPWVECTNERALKYGAFLSRDEFSEFLPRTRNSLFLIAKTPDFFTRGLIVVSNQCFLIQKK